MVCHDIFFKNLTHIHLIDLVGSFSKFEDTFSCKILLFRIKFLVAEVATGGVLSKKVFLKTSPNSHENSYVGSNPKVLKMGGL